jgi:hypothetical protein
MDISCTLYIACYNTDNGIIPRQFIILQIISLLDHVQNHNSDVTPLSDTKLGFSLGTASN